MKAFASVIPLNYGSHVEFSIVLVEPVWTNLIPLLADPQKWLIEASKSWQSRKPPHDDLLKRASPDVPWKLNAPATAIVRPLTDRPDLAPLISGLYPYYHQDPAPIYGDINPTEWATIIKDMWPLMFSQGLFIAEFAANTSLLFISYLPPTVPDPAGPHYKKDLTQPTIAFLQFPSLVERFPVWNSITASVHCDLTDNSTGGAGMTRLDRAQFAVDMLESRQGFANQLNGSEGFLESYHMVEPGNAIVPDMNETAVTLDTKSPQIAFASIPASVNGASDFVTITIEGLMSKALADTCCITTTPQTKLSSKTTTRFVLKDLALKDYQSDGDED